MQRPTSRLPAGLLRIARQLARCPDVCGVYWGMRRRAGEWTDEPCISIEVYKKHATRRLPAERRLPRRIEGFRIDVVEARRVCAAALSARYRVHADHEVSAITCIRGADAGGCLALLSGHGTAPLAGAGLQRSYDRPPHPAVAVEARLGAHTYSGELAWLRVSRWLDFAVAAFADADVDDEYSLGDGETRKSALVAGKPVYHVSPLDQTKHEGVLDIGLAEQEVDLERGGRTIFSRLIRVRAGADQSFAVPGDSGSLVVDDAGRAIGTVVAVEESARLAYVLPLYGLYSEFPAVFSRFFQ